jgi:hypothetical protein
LYEQTADRGQLALAAEERRRRDRQVRLVERLQPRELTLAELPDPLRGAQVLEPVLPEVAEALASEQGGGRGRDEHLAAVPGSCDAGGAVHVGADVALLGQERRARVQAHPHRELERLLRLARRGERAGGGREGDEEGIALGVDLDPVVAGEGLAQDAPVGGERFGVRLRAQLVQQPGRALDVGEEEGDGADR